jgi:hypothetical protein
LTEAVPDHFALYALLAGFVLALGVVALGVAIVVRRGLVLKQKVDALKELPFAPVLELTQARIDIATRSIDGLPRMMDRASRAFGAIAAARANVTNSALEATSFLRGTLRRR